MYLDRLFYLFLVTVTICCCLQQTSFAAAIESQSLEHEHELPKTIIETITSTTIVIVSSISLSQSSSLDDKFWTPISMTPAPETTTESELSVDKHPTGVCTATMMHFPKFTLGPTRTIYPLTRTVTVYIDCEGCDTLVTRNIGGHGPVVFVTTTVMNVVPTTTTTFKCSRTLDVNSD